LRKAKIFGHDHLELSPYIIGKRDYTYIEDGPLILSIYYKSKFHSDICKHWTDLNICKKTIASFISGVFDHPVANNKQCGTIILTLDDDAPHVAGKSKIILPLDTAWKDLSDKRKQYILNIFGVAKEDIISLQNKTHILLTQQFSSDGFISEAEQIEIYRQILEKYDPSCLVIKTHPRETVNYRNYFPQIYVFDKIVPMQLLLLMGTNFKKAITLFSSSINMFPDTVEKEWIGSSVHPALHELFPNLDRNIYV
jgi:hypothetical protein